jgi:hypothetical protein
MAHFPVAARLGSATAISLLSLCTSRPTHRMLDCFIARLLYMTSASRTGWLLGAEPSAQSTIIRQTGRFKLSYFV